MADTSAPPLNIVLYQPEIAPNTGAVGRTCVAVGARLWLVRPLGFDLDDRKLRRAGMDYWRHLDLAVVDGLDEVAAAIFGTMWYFSTKGRRSYWDVVYRAGDALVFGPETRGLPASLVEQNPDASLRIPIRPEARSLNLSNSVAVAAFEAVRQLGQIL